MTAASVTLGVRCAGSVTCARGGTRAPSTVGSWLRAHEWSDVRQLDVIGATARGLPGVVCD